MKAIFTSKVMCFTVREKNTFLWVSQTLFGTGKHACSTHYEKNTSQKQFRLFDLCINSLVSQPAKQSVSGMRQGHNPILVFTRRHAFTFDSVIDVYVNVF